MKSVSANAAYPTSIEPQRGVDATRWFAAAAVTVALHVAVLLVSFDVVHGTGADEFAPMSIEVSLETAAPKPPPTIEVPVVERAPVDFTPQLAQIGGDSPFLISAPTITTLPAQSKLSSTNAGGATSQALSPDTSGGRSGDIGSGSEDAPLAAGSLDNFTSSAGTGGAGGPSGAGNGAGIGRGDGGSGTGSGGGTGKGFGGALNRAVGALRPPAPTEALRLPGKPLYPRSCRQGLCRGGQPCEGSSKWKVTVAAAGGKPLRVECLEPMLCELQNASIKKYFQQSDFPKTEQASVYVFPVKMYVQDE